MIAWPRWVLSAATVSATPGSVVVKKAWKRQVSNSVSCLWLLPGLRSGIRRPGSPSRAGGRTATLITGTSSATNSVPVFGSVMAHVFSRAVEVLQSAPPVANSLPLRLGRALVHSRAGGVPSSTAASAFEDRLRPGREEPFDAAAWSPGRLSSANAPAELVGAGGKFQRI
jgi:hypothetical protein